MKSNSFSGRVPFLLLPRNEDFVRGNSRYPAIKDRAGIILMLLLLITFLALTGSLLYQQYIAAQLTSRGTVTTATVLDRGSSSGRSTTYTLAYEYQAALTGQQPATYRQSQTVASKTFDKHPAGSKITIAYLPDNPNISQLAGPDADPNYASGQLIAVVLPIFIAFGGLLYFVWPVYKDRRLASGGSIIKGQVVERQGQYVTARRRYYELTIKYSFASPTDGTTLEGTQSLPRNDLKPDNDLRANAKLPAPGAAVAVLYLDNEHYKML
jgi:hypothetical protein